MRKGIFRYFTRGEFTLWGVSVLLITAAFLVFDRKDVLTLCASLVGITSLIFNAKGNPIGQLLIVLFSILYGIISYRSAYYGEMITYLGMTAPIAVAAFISWVRNPYHGNHSEVAINRISAREWTIMAVASVAVTVAFYFILDAFDTKNMLPSTLSVCTSFAAVYLTARRSAYFAAAYAANDVVLIVLWSLAAKSDSGCVSVIVCFALFLISDLYGFVCWQRRLRLQDLDSLNS